MNWFLAKIIYRIICGSGTHTPQYEVQLRLVQAASKAEALNKAMEMGRSEQHDFLNLQQKLVQWKFINVSELYALHKVVDGTEIYSRIEEKEDSDTFEHMVHKRARYLMAAANPLHLPA